MTSKGNRPCCGWLDLYTSPYGFFQKYHCHNNEQDWNYIMWRKGVKEELQDVFMLIQTSAHCYTVTHFRIMDGHNELRKFIKLFDAAQYLLAAMREYDEKYAEYIAEQDRAKDELQLRRDAKRTATPTDMKVASNITTRKGEGEEEE